MPPKRKATLANPPAKRAARGRQSSKQPSQEETGIEKSSNKESAQTTDQTTHATATTTAVASTAVENPPATTQRVEDYLLLIRLSSSSDPVIKRLLCVRSDITFAQLHEVLQVAFDWASCHAHSFSVSKLLKEGEVRRYLFLPALLPIQSKGIITNFFLPTQRPSWMSVRGPEVLTLLPDDFLKDAYPDPEQIKKTADYTLADIYDAPLYKGQVVVTYEYDHGDSWEHEIRLLGRADPILRPSMLIPENMKAVCLSGEGHPCAEDCGGELGWEDLKRCFKGKKDPEGRRDWYKYTCANGDPKGLDPFRWDILEVNRRLLKMTF